MYLKQFNKQGDKYYINAFTGVTVQIPTVNPLKREPNPELLRLMMPRFSYGFLPGWAENNQRTIFVGDFKKLMNTDPEKRNRREFIKVCKRVNVNPYPLFNTSYDQYYNCVSLNN